MRAVNLVPAKRVKVRAESLDVDAAVRCVGYGIDDEEGMWIRGVHCVGDGADRRDAAEDVACVRYCYELCAV